MASGRLKYHSSTIKIWFWLLSVFGVLSIINGVALLALGGSSYYDYDGYGYDDYDDDYDYDNTPFYAGGAGALVLGFALLITAFMLYRRPFNDQQTHSAYDSSKGSIPMHMNGQFATAAKGPAHVNSAQFAPKEGSMSIARFPQNNATIQPVQNCSQYTDSYLSQTAEIERIENHEESRAMSAAVRFCTSCGTHVPGQYCGNCGKLCASSTH